MNVAYPLAQWLHQRSKSTSHIWLTWDGALLELLISFCLMLDFRLAEFSNHVN